MKAIGRQRERCMRDRLGVFRIDAAITCDRIGDGNDGLGFLLIEAPHLDAFVSVVVALFARGSGVIEPVGITNGAAFIFARRHGGSFAVSW